MTGVRPHVGHVLTDKPGIVIARPPRRIKKAAKPAKPAAVIVGRKVAPETPEEGRDHARAEAAERLWREMVRRVEGGRERTALGPHANCAKISQIPMSSA
jgi:hypothetical protein